VAPFPAPATSHVASGFPALGAPAHFTPRVIYGPMVKKLVEILSIRHGQVTRVTAQRALAQFLERVRRVEQDPYFSGSYFSEAC
jgi:hypothetical protein